MWRIEGKGFPTYLNVCAIIKNVFLLQKHDIFKILPQSAFHHFLYGHLGFTWTLSLTCYKAVCHVISEVTWHAQLTLILRINVIKHINSTHGNKQCKCYPLLKLKPNSSPDITNPKILWYDQAASRYVIFLISVTHMFLLSFNPKSYGDACICLSLIIPYFVKLFCLFCQNGKKLKNQLMACDRHIYHTSACPFLV